jgi:uncharacterized Zn finger protein
MAVICDRETGIFPSPKEIRMSCTCPDWADMCKHVAAVLYGVGVRFDTDPMLLFKLRGVDPLDLFGNGTQAVRTHAGATDQELLGEDLGALFGIDLVAGADVEPGGKAPRAQEISRDCEGANPSEASPREGES